MKKIAIVFALLFLGNLQAENEVQLEQAALFLQTAKKDTLVDFTHDLTAILDEVTRIDSELEKMIFWSKFRVLRYFKKRYLDNKIANQLQNDLDVVGDLITHLSDTLEDGGPNSYKQELSKHYNTMQGRINEFLLQSSFNTNTKQLEGVSAEFTKDLKRNVELCNEVLGGLSHLKGKLRSITWWCKIKRLGIPFLVRWCVKSKGSKLAINYLSALRSKINDLPNGPIQQELHAKVTVIEKDFLINLKK